MLPLWIKAKYGKFKKYIAHSSHVTNVRWAHNDRLLVTVGGADTSVIIWTYEVDGHKQFRHYESEESDFDSDEDGGRYSLYSAGIQYIKWIVFTLHESAVR